MKIPRVYSSLEQFLVPGKALIIYRPRQVGKTTLLKDYVSGHVCRYKFETGDDLRTQHITTS
jgi:predicted AAA+ superfamily ATPase